MRLNKGLIFALFFSILLTYSCSKDEPELPENPNVENPDEPDNTYLNELQTAKDVAYLSDEEKDIFFYINYARKYPKEFLEKYAAPYSLGKNVTKPYAYDERKKSLEEELASMKPLHVYTPDDYLYSLADCFATQGGQLGIVGHSRENTTCTKGYLGECVAYGNTKALDIVMQLLIDWGKGNEALGHRRILFYSSFTKLGLATREHKKHNHCTVLDFGQ